MRDRDELSDLIRAKQDGRIITPPCKLGDVIYVIPSKENGLKEITEMVVRGFALGEPYNVANCFRTSGEQE